MSSLKVLKEKIKGMEKTAKVTKAMESISAVKMRKAQKEILNARPYVFSVFGLLKRLSKIVGENIDSAFSKVSDHGGSVCILLISSDRGLAGALNISLFKEVKKKLEEFSDREVFFVCIGKKGYEFAKKEGYKVEKYFDFVDDNSSVDIFHEVSNFLIDQYNQKKFTRLLSVYTNFINTSEQKPVSKQMLPIVYENLKDFLKNSVPTKGKFSDPEKIDVDSFDVNSYIFEPDIYEVLREIIPTLLNIEIYYSILESRASEHSSRMLAMKNATDKSLELKENFRKKFNKQRQAFITKEISEITSGMESMDENN